MIANLGLGNLFIECADPVRARDFYAELGGWERRTLWELPALATPEGLVVLFSGTDTPYARVTWPGVPGEQQQQMHLDFQVDDVPEAVAEAVRLGATRPEAQYGGTDFVTLLDPEGHPFCLCQR
ncbi:MAG: VOC family protein [Propionibacteriaceae bacterium]|jgi:catechol 2,3-dioxygenase-like lactoylglutathione lyase family enzyme|nr:VOC family protein [Propionibacteriaceae bacterium]